MRRILPVVVLALLGIANVGSVHAQRGNLPSMNNPRQPRATPGINAPAAAPVPTPNSKAKPAAPELPGDAAVITLHGLCPKDAPANADPKTCNTIVTKDQFEDMLSAVSLGGQVYSANAIRTVADNYVQYLVLSDVAQRTGIDKDPRVQELLEVVRLRTLADAYRHSMEEKFRSPSSEEIEKFYHDNISKFETVKAERLFIPKYNPRSPKGADSADFEKKAHAVAQEIQVRASKGESLDHLQTEAFQKLGIPAPALLPDTGLRRRGTFPAEMEDEIFSLKPGEVSKIENETGGFVVYRLIRKDTYTLEQSKGEVVTLIYRQKMEAAVKNVLQAVKTDFNDKYFLSPTQARPLQTTGTPVPGSGSKRMQSSRSMKLPSNVGKPAAPASIPAPK